MKPPEMINTLQEVMALLTSLMHSCSESSEIAATSEIPLDFEVWRGRMRTSLLSGEITTAATTLECAAISIPHLRVFVNCFLYRKTFITVKCFHNQTSVFTLS